MHASLAGHYHWSTRKKLKEVVEKANERAKTIKHLREQMSIATRNAKSAEKQLGERDATIAKLSLDLAEHEKDSDTIERLQAELKDRAKDAEALKKCKADLAKVRKEKKEAEKNSFARTEAFQVRAK